MEYKVMINEFEGPLDLLLSLIKKSDISIYDISIFDITDQYLEYIQEMEKLNLNVSSEYLVMAAELLEIKSNMLLPKPKLEEDEEDPQEELINKLLLYKHFKEVSSKLRELEEERNLMYSKAPSDISEYKEEIIIENDESISLDALVLAFSEFLNRKEEEKPLHTRITSKEYSVSERSFEIKTLLKKKGKLEFTELFDFLNKDFVIVTFLSILDLSRKQEIMISQENNFDKIVLMIKGGN